MNETISKVVDELNKLLNKKKSLHAISYEFDKLSDLLRPLNIRMIIHQTKKYCFDEELNNILVKKQSDETTFQEYMELSEMKKNLELQRNNI